MANWKTIAKTRGALSAAEELLRCSIDRESPIDIFDIIESQGIWLIFEELDSALGTFFRQPSAGILINNYRPRSVQRLTAAHEYGHFVLGHTASLDGHREIDGFSAVRQEVEAQAFALDFLMPLELVEKSWDALRLPDGVGSILPHHAYQLATSMGVSFKACVVQLSAMEKISVGYAKDLINYEPKAIKRQITGGVGPIDSAADVWPVEEADNGKQLQIRQKDEIHLKLPEAPATGYRWILTDSEDNGAFQVVGDEFETLAREQELIGAGGHRFFSVRAQTVGKWHLVFQKSRPWAAHSSIETFSLLVDIHPNVFGGEQTGPREGIKKLLLTGGR